MRRILGIVILLCVFSIGCNDKQKKTIPLDIMALIVADMDLADKMVREFPMAKRDSMAKVLEKNILKVHKVSQEELEINLYLYQSDYEEYGKLLNKISEIYDTKS